MRKILLLNPIAIALATLLFSSGCSVPSSESTRSTPTNQPAQIRRIQYRSYILPRSVVHTVSIPVRDGLAIAPAIATKLDTVEGMARKHRVSAVLNGGFFDPSNQKTTSYVIQRGKLVADPRQNDRLMKNRQLAPYLPQILDRTEFRRYLCGQTFRYDIVQHRDRVLANCQLVDALSGGPQLLPQMTLAAEGFLDIDRGKVIRDPLGSNQRNARSAIGITRDGNIVWMMVAQKPNLPTNSGMSLSELAEFMKTLGVEKAMNLDGGSSSALYYQGQIFYGKFDRQGNQVKRLIKSVLLILER
jgi:exopolysaccharide biosynthesis protein